jgi:hypothetical protein
MIRWLAILIALWPMKMAAQLQKRPLGLERMEAEADLVFKGRVISSEAITNKTFPLSFAPHSTTLDVISVFKGNLQTNVVTFLHNTKGPNAWGGGTPPPHCRMELERCYLIFAEKTETVGVFRQISSGPTREDEGVTLTLDDSPLAGMSIKEAHWFELQRLLTNNVSTNALHAIQKLNGMSERCGRDWGHTHDFSRGAVLELLQPLIMSKNEEIALAAISCFQIGGSITENEAWSDYGTTSVPRPVESNCAAQVRPHATALIEVATHGQSTARRLAALSALSRTKFSTVSNSIPRWLEDSNENVRAQAVLLLPDFPGEYCERSLREKATDPSPIVRAAVADAIGEGKCEILLPVLEIFFSTSPTLTNSGPLLSKKGLYAANYFDEVSGDDIRASAGYALFKFDVNQVGAFLKRNLNDPRFGDRFLCKLAERDPGTWQNELIGVLQERRERILKQVEASGVEPKTNYYQALMQLSGTYFQCWNLIYEHLKGSNFSEFADGKLDHCLDELEKAGDTGSREPLMLYELYRMKGLNERADKFRKQSEQRFAVYHMTEFFDKVDAQYSRNGTIPDQ